MDHRCDSGKQRPSALRRKRGACGFTLIELIVTLTILVIVLGMAYKILENTLKTEQWVEKTNLPEKVGQGILAEVRKDLEGAIFLRLGTDQVFEVIDNGDGELGRDEIRCFTTREPVQNLEAETGQAHFDPANIRTITAVSYYLKENRNGLYTLFRRESTPNGVGDPFQGGTGVSTEIYDKVKSLNIWCFDAQAYEQGIDPWLPFWDSRQRFQDIATQQANLAAQPAGLPRVAGLGQGAQGQGPNRSATPGGAAGAAGAAGANLSDTGETLPPVPIPSAVRVEIAIYAGDEKGIYKETDGRPMNAKVYSALIPILAAQQMALSQETDDASATGADSMNQLPRAGGTGGPGGPSGSGSGTRGGSPRSGSTGKR